MLHSLLIKKAKRFATQKHKKQIRDDGITPYIVHPQQVAELLSVVTTDEDIIAAGWLHDVVEDQGVTPDELTKEFNQRVSDLVMEVTHEGKKDEVGFYFPRLHTQDGIMIKFADRLSNLSDLRGWDKKRGEQYLRKSKFWKSEGVK